MISYVLSSPTEQQGRVLCVAFPSSSYFCLSPLPMPSIQCPNPSLSYIIYCPRAPPSLLYLYSNNTQNIVFRHKCTFSQWNSKSRKHTHTHCFSFFRYKASRVKSNPHIKAGNLCTSPSLSHIPISPAPYHPPTLF